MITTTLHEKNDTLVVLIGEPQLDITNIDASVLIIDGMDWNKDLSPWYADKIMKKGEDFAGDADILIDQILSLEVLQRPWKHKILVGYSLAGLFTLYTCTKTNYFEACASVSGSLWFPNWNAYLQSHPPRVNYAYLSLGDLEAKTKNPIMSKVEEETQKTYQLLQEQSIQTVFEMNQGNHFFESDARIHKAIKNIIENNSQ